MVATDLLIGIVLGTISALFWVFRANRFASICVVHTGADWLIRFNKDASFVNKSELKEAFRKIPNNTHVVIDATRASIVDNDIYETIGEFAQAATFRCVDVEFVNVFGKQR